VNKPKEISLREMRIIDRTHTSHEVIIWRFGRILESLCVSHKDFSVEGIRRRRAAGNDNDSLIHGRKWSH
jgi:hypothetical protein